MATLLYRLGRFSFRRRRLTVVVWVMLLGLFGLGAAQLSGPTSDELSIPGTESLRALDVAQLDKQQKLELLRTYALLFIRLGEPGLEAAAAVRMQLDPAER